ncbi:hypothetical protein N431DRAFT_497739 [Stipitochalara longipes BDJ]|nr:hypothetical protein N431DRAFT_497739 [Stipitochalara longipes BDJ]
MSTAALTQKQIDALFDILTHHATYAEIQAYAWPDTIHDFGHPFTEKGAQFSSPILYTLVNGFITKQPGIDSLPPDFWQARLGVLVSNMGSAELSESYDKGAMGTRETLATASATLLESAARSYVGGYARSQNYDPDRNYSLNNAEHLMQGWEDAAQGLVYGDLMDELFDQMAESARLADKSPVMQAAMEYILIWGASLLHHIFVLSPDGQYLLKLLENVNKLIPYVAIRQILRIGNLLLAKMSVGSNTKWVGMRKNADPPMNLLQRIISTVLGWDNSDFRGIVVKIEKNKNGPSSAHLEAIKLHVQKPRPDREHLRAISIEQSKSAVIVIFENARPPLSTALSDSQHTQALEYYAALLSIRDREELIRIVCRQEPDLFTPSVREMVAAYELGIRSVHKGVDFSGAISDIQGFLDGLIKLGKAKNNDNRSSNIAGTHRPPTVEDYVSLFRKYLPCLLRYMHQMAKNCPEIRESFREYGKEALRGFRHDSNESGSVMTDPLNQIFSTIPSHQQPIVFETLDAHSAYLTTLRTFSMERTQSIIDNISETMYGTGVYFARWHALLNETLITPATAVGPVRRGRDVKYKEGKGKGKAMWDSEAIAREAMREVPEPPDVSIVVNMLGVPFKDILQEMVVVA